MKRHFLYLLVSSFFSFSIESNELLALYNSLDPESVPQAFSFYELYPETYEGQKALARAASLLHLPSLDIAARLGPLINRMKGEQTYSKEDVDFIESLASHLPNRKLKGYFAKTNQEIIALETEEIDIGMALLLSQLSEDPNALEQAKAYSAMLDLMALQILAHLPKNASPEEKIKETNRLIFNEMRFRFPPQSVYSQDIDLYTFLPSVMDNHLGVCLGVTALYLAIAQRIDLPLEIVTPPGHIFIRYHDQNKLINIETTARGIHVPSDSYLGVNTKSLPLRTLKEVVAWTHVNQASIYLRNGSFEKAAQCYEKAFTYMSYDPLVDQLLGFSYLLTGKKKEGEALLRKVVSHISEEAIFGETTVSDYLNGYVDKEGIKAAYLSVDETRSSILTKQKQLTEILERYPRFREGWLQLAVSWIQLNRKKEAISALKEYHRLESGDPTCEYFLCMLFAERGDYKSAWHHLKNAENITGKHAFSPKALREARRELIRLCPEV